MSDLPITAIAFLKQYPALYNNIMVTRYDKNGNQLSHIPICNWGDLLYRLKNKPRSIDESVATTDRATFIDDLISALPTETPNGPFSYVSNIYGESNGLSIRGAAFIEEMMRRGLAAKIDMSSPLTGGGNVLIALMKGLSHADETHNPLPWLRFLTDRQDGYESVARQFQADRNHMLSLPDASFQDSEGLTPLHHAIMSGPGRDLAYRYRAGALDGEWIRKVAEKTIANCAVRGAELLPEAARMLLDYGADPTRRDAEGMTAIERARWLVDLVLPEARNLAQKNAENHQTFEQHLNFIEQKSRETTSIIERYEQVFKWDASLRGQGIGAERSR